MANREYAQSKIDDVVKELGMDKDQRQEFHRWLGKYYPDEKDEFTYNELLEKGREFLSQYS